MARFLITGGAGFIGSHLADALVARGDQVTLLDDLSTGTVVNVRHLLEGPQARLELGSVLDAPLVQRLAGDADVIVHLAASVGVQLVIQKPLDCLMNNIRGTEVVLAAAALDGTKVLLASTSEIYGKNGRGPLREDTDRVLGSPFTTRWTYSTSKAVDEILACQAFRQAGLPTIVARLFNCAGPRQTGAYGMVIPRFVRQALTGEDLTVFGDGTQSRCFCHVGDTVDAIVRLLHEPQAVGDVFNIGSQYEITIRDLADLVLELSDSSSSVRYVAYEDAYEPGFEDMHRRLPDIDKLGAVTGWVPRRSLEDIVKDVIEFELDAVASVSPA